jgi:hypothetical protein
VLGSVFVALGRDVRRSSTDPCRRAITLEVNETQTPSLWLIRIALWGLTGRI